MNILFVCKWNKFRSKAAEAIFKKLTTEHTAKSAGLFPGLEVTEDIVEAGKHIGITIAPTSQGLSHDLLMWSDYIIIVAEDVPSSIFKEVAANDGKKVIHWNIEDVNGINVKKREGVMLLIQDKVKEFLEELN